jgi:hypothetical protein
MSQNKMRIGMSLRGHGYHLAAWRHPDVPADASVRIDHLSLSRFMVHATFEARRSPRWLADPCTGRQSCPPAFLATARVTVDELPRLVPSFDAALPAQRACRDTLCHVRMHRTLWPLQSNRDKLNSLRL